MLLTPDLKDVDVFAHTCTQSPKPWLPSRPTPHEVSTALNSQASLRCSYLPTKAVPYQSSNPVPAPLGTHTPCLQCAPSKTTMTPPRSETECAPQQKLAASSGGVSLDCQPRKMVIVLSPLSTCMGQFGHSPHHNKLQRSQAWQHEVADEPVSYTHLTLPTKA